jgi:hypothetical protein
MTSRLRDWIVLLAMAIAFCVAFLVEPDWNLQEAHLLCDGQPVQVFESMSACALDQPPGCPCIRPDNPWTFWFWVVVLPALGIAAALLLRSPGLRSAAFLAGALAIGGGCALFFIGQRESFDEEAWAASQLVVAIYISVILVAFGAARLVRRMRSSYADARSAQREN